MAIAGDYKGRTKGTQSALDAIAGFRVDPVHFGSGGYTNQEVCQAGSVVVGWDINVAPQSGGITLVFANGPNGIAGDIIVNNAVTGRSYGKPFYCPWNLLVSTPGSTEDITFYVRPPAKGVTVD